MAMKNATKRQNERREEVLIRYLKANEKLIKKKSTRRPFQMAFSP